MMQEHRDNFRDETRPCGSVLIIDDDPDMLALLGGLLEVRGLRTEAVGTTHELFERLARQTWDLIVMDLYIGKETALEFIPEVLRLAPYSKVAVISAFGSIDAAVFAMELGAATFLQKTVDLDELVSKLLNFVPRRESRTEGASQDPLAAIGLPLVGESATISQIREALPGLARSDAPYLLEGPAGTGKELVARSAHELSTRKHFRFEAINCAALTEEALDQELFGDAGTGDFPGLFFECQGGTVLLKEVASLSPRMQEKLIYVLHEGHVPLPDGTESDEPVRARIVASSRICLKQEVAAGRFREDLFGLLGLKTIRMPPLADRPEDLAPLALHFAHVFATRYGKRMQDLSPDCLSLMTMREWKGDVRELQNTIERAVVLSKNGEWNAEHLGLDAQISGEIVRQGGEAIQLSLRQESLLYSEAKEAFEKAFLEKLLEHSHGNVSEAARISGRFRSDLYRLMSKYNIKRSGSGDDSVERDYEPENG